MLELLAPAKDKICAKAAIDYGADAIYIGASEFGARKNVPNSLLDIEEIVGYAHKYNVKVYVALNTILTDDEIERAKELIEKLDKMGVDAIIIQDMGLLDAKSKVQSVKCHCDGSAFTHEAIHNTKNLEFHASTQCDNRTPEKVKFLESVGFSRVILARELSIEQIKEIRKQTNVELESFIHGALCVSYSGQCYMSYLIGGRSANRGECAQPCRKKYSLIDEDGNYIAKDKYLLCLKDFNASKHLKELAEAGITSFKIEGRLKDENYVKNVVGYYRKLIDKLGYEKTSSGQIIFDFEPNLEKSFNRGFTDYFLDRAEAGAREDSRAQRRLPRGSRNNDEIFNFDSPKSKGEYIGKVTKIGKDFFEINEFPPHLRGRVREGGKKIAPQDGLCFFQNGELSGCLVNKVEGNKIYPSISPHLNPPPQVGRKNNYDEDLIGIKIGTEIYRNLDFGFEKALKNSKTGRKLGANIDFELGKIKAIDEDNNSVEFDYNFEEFAQNTEKMGLNIITQFKKSGESDFLVEDVKILTDKIPFLPISKLNELRRELLEKLMQERLKNYKRSSVKQIDGTATEFPQTKIDYKGNILNKGSKEFYEKHGCEITEFALESGGKCTGGKCTEGKCVTNKVAMTCKHCIRFAFDMCKKSEHTKNKAKDLFLVDEKGKRYPLKFNCSKGSNLCEMEILF